MKHFGKLITALGVFGFTLACTPGAYATAQTFYEETTADTAPNPAVIAAALVVIVAMFAAMALSVRLGRSGKLNVPWATLSALLAALAMLVCILGSSVGALYSAVDGNPTDTVTRFYDALIARDYSTAYSCLRDYTGLGLETPPESENAALIYDALKDSYEYALAGEAKIDKLTAKQNVRFKYLDLASLEASVEDGVQRNLDKLVESRPASEVYDENDKYLPAVTEEAYSAALASVLTHASSYYTSTVIELELNYHDGEWLIVTNRDMLNALMGGVAY